MENEKKTSLEQNNQLSRREFIARTGMAAAAFTILPGGLYGFNRRSPNDKLNIAVVGIGGKGNSDARAFAEENLVAFCDVDETLNPELKKDFPNAVFYKDYRVMLEKQKNIDAVVISTPDHTHAIIAMAAMKAGKHVFVQKPLTHTIYEARRLAEVAKEKNLVTQMGNQGHAGEEARLLNEWIADGAIGDISEVHVWTNRPIWPQGALKRPTETPEVPSTLDWDLFLGPAPSRPYHSSYHPFNWRGLWDFGTGALGDMGAHFIDQPFWALDLGHPLTVQASSSQYNDDYYPLASMVTYQFPARGNKPPVKLVWYDGGLMPQRPAELEPGRKMGDVDGGVLFYGTKGTIMHGIYGKGVRIIPETKMQEYVRPEKTIPRSPGIHQEWIDAIKKGTKSTTDFSYSGKLTEVMLLGNIAIRMHEKNTVLEWDPVKMEITNLPEANPFIHVQYRDGWSLE